MTKDAILIDGFKHFSHTPEQFPENEILEKTAAYLKFMDKRRSIRHFSDKLVPLEILENIIKTASTAPSGANKQPWTFCLIQSPKIKHKIREAAEAEEEKSYAKRMNESWLKDLAPLGTNADKPFLETAPYLIVVFKKPYEIDKNGEKRQNYYVNESVGMACGLLIAAIHNAGLVTLTHTPSPMRFLEQILERPSNERAFLLLPVGYPAKEVYVPGILRKPLEKIYKLY
ncbi:MAG: nitroreductase family protein [Flavobacteriaceae bacterium]|nr:MAG: nitroreductase family protein [Flavobacteriaceae bacterium]